MRTRLNISIAIALFFSLISCSPSTEELYIKAKKLQDKKEYSKAIGVYDLIIHREPRFQDATFMKAYCHLQDSNYAKALYYFEFILSMKGVNNGTGFIMEKNPDIPFASEEDKHQISVQEVYYQMG